MTVMYMRFAAALVGGLVAAFGWGWVASSIGLWVGLLGFDALVLLAGKVIGFDCEIVVRRSKHERFDLALLGWTSLLPVVLDDGSEP